MGTYVLGQNQLEDGQDHAKVMDLMIYFLDYTSCSLHSRSQKCNTFLKLTLLLKWPVTIIMPNSKHKDTDIGRQSTEGNLYVRMETSAAYLRSHALESSSLTWSITSFVHLTFWITPQATCLSPYHCQFESSLSFTWLFYLPSSLWKNWLYHYLS